MALLPVSEALRRILDSAATLPSESVGLLAARGRTLAEAITSKVDNPPFDASAMDGYAVRSEDVATVPVTLTVVGEAGAGRPFTDTLRKRQAVRIFTGGILPPGADAIVIQENTTASGSEVTVLETAQRDANVRTRGQDFAAGEVLVEPGRLLTARDVLISASAGYAELSVARKPVVAILSTGDELVAPGEPLGPGQISGSNAYGLSGVVEAAGGEARFLGIARDSLASLDEFISAAEDADVLVTSGGASVGDHDLVRPALEKAGAQLDFYKIAMRPGKPLFFGSRQISGRRQYCVGLPGNPVSAMICARVFLVPLIGRLLGRETPFEALDAVLTDSIPANGPREHYMRGELDVSSVPARVTAFKKQDSGLVKFLQRANCLVVIPADSPALDAGASVRVLKLDI
ncbi:gephyrin-like molybdotransferase Glp [Hyphomicrobium sp.]|uniref:molybdopterin molybdotransferase MoeA n=1 Tax=Hyphomicrobium sp. TaxID=82 RepID=UPI000F9597E8|nr:gephyrin-like molybdotransferase Glp [Hyphomicrobium sp.]RUO97592.1 MAG: molybdopterin molybdenumtransferase MoeA [Hyphomicrobium sp.]